MSRQGVKLVIAALISNPQFNKAFFANKTKTLKASGFDLTKNEIKALQYLRRKDVILKMKLTKPYDVVLPVKTQGPRPPGGDIR